MIFSKILGKQGRIIRIQTTENCLRFAVYNKLNRQASERVSECLRCVTVHVSTLIDNGREPIGNEDNGFVVVKTCLWDKSLQQGANLSVCSNTNEPSLQFHKPNDYSYHSNPVCAEVSTMCFISDVGKLRRLSF